MKGSNSQPGRRTKDWANTKGELVCCVEAPPRHWKQQGRCVTARAGRQRAAPISAPETSILHQNVSRLSVAPTSSWDPGQLTSTRKVAASDQLPKGDTQRSRCAPRKQSSWDRGGDKHTASRGESALAKHLFAWAAQTWEGHRTQVQLSLCFCGVPKNLNLSGLDLGSACNPGPALDSSPAEQPGAWAV